MFLHRCKGIYVNMPVIALGIVVLSLGYASKHIWIVIYKASVSPRCNYRNLAAVIPSCLFDMHEHNHQDLQLIIRCKNAYYLRCSALRCMRWVKWLLIELYSSTP